MKVIPAGTFLMGSSDHYAEEAPVRAASVDSFLLSSTTVTNEQFSEFVDDSGYVTLAEIAPNPADYPGAPPENLLAASLVFQPTPGPVDLRNISQWWHWRPGASWLHPEGPDSGINDRLTHPVVHLAYPDVLAFTEWSGTRLPTEIEWERAARGDHEGTEYTWGTEKFIEGKRMAKFFEGQFPWKNETSDNWERTAPVGSFPANDYGLFDMAGNVWEWTSDYFSAPRADSPNERDSLDPHQPQIPIPRRVLKGGSFICADEYCQRYRPAARRPQMIDTAMSHVGFRCASDPT